MKAVDFLELLVRDHCYGQWNYQIEQSGDHVVITSYDTFSGSFLHDLSRVCEMVVIAWCVQNVGDKLVIDLWAGKDLFKAGEKDE